MRTFHCRSVELMLTLWESLVLNILDCNCSQLSHQNGINSRDKGYPEVLYQRDPCQNREDYWERLGTFGRYSMACLISIRWILSRHGYSLRPLALHLAKCKDLWKQALYRSPWLKFLSLHQSVPFRICYSSKYKHLSMYLA